MSKRKNISAVISLKDNMSATLRGISKEQTKFRAEVAKTKRDLMAQQKQANKEIDLKISQSKLGKTLKKFKTAMSPLRKKYITRIATKEINAAKRKRIKRELKQLSRAVFSPAIKIKDKISGPLKKIKKGLSGMKGLILAAGLGAAGKSLLSQGAELEQQKISMKHFMGAGNKNKTDSQVSAMSTDYLKNLRKNSNETPFETKEVVAAGTRGLQVAGGNSKEALKMVSLAEDMAAMNPGKSIEDAMEALADSKNGEMERLKEFGLDASSSDSFEDVKGQLSSLYEGGAKKLSQSGLGLWSTIKGKLKSSVADAGLKTLDALKPALQGVITLIDSGMPVINKIGGAIGNGIGNAITFLKSQLPVLGPIFSQAFTAIKTIVMTVGPIIGDVIKALWPVFTTLASVVASALSVVAKTVKTVAPFVKKLISAISPAIKTVCNSVKTMGSKFSSIFSTIRKTIKSAYDFISPLIKGIGEMMGAVGNGIETVSNFVFGENATGTKYWSGGVSLVGEHGPELVEMPRGAKVHTNTELNYMAKRANSKKQKILTENKSLNNIRESSRGVNININIDKFADTFEVKDQSDIKSIAKEIANEIVSNIKIESKNYGGVF